MPLHVLLPGVSIIKISRFCQNSSLQPKQSSVHQPGVHKTVLIKKLI